MEIPANIFREYDIRGVADRDMPDPFALQLGRAAQKQMPMSATPQQAARAL